MARPKDPQAKRKRFEIRIDEDDLMAINFLADNQQISRSEAILEAVWSRYAEMQSVLSDRQARYKD